MQIQDCTTKRDTNSNTIRNRQHGNVPNATSQSKSTAIKTIPKSRQKDIQFDSIRFCIKKENPPPRQSYKPAPSKKTISPQQQQNLLQT